MTRSVIPTGQLGATQEEAETGIRNDVAMTPLRTMQCFVANAASMVSAAVNTALTGLGFPDPSGQDGKILKVVGGSYALADEAVAAIPLKTSYAEDGAMQQTLSTDVIPLDNSKAQSGEGKQVLTVTHTPSQTGVKLLVDALLNVSNSDTVSAVAALFKDGDANSLAVGVARGYGAHDRATLRIRKGNIEAPDTTPIVFKVNLGCMAGYAGVITLNGTNGSQLFDGAYISSITVTEYA